MKATYAAFMIIVLLIGWIIAPAPLAHACSGPHQPINWLVENSSHVIKGYVIESDDAGQNHIVHVESYVMGEPGPEYVLVRQNTLADIQGLRDGYLGSGDCNYLAPTPPSDLSFYMFVNRAQDGAYDQVGGMFSADFYSFPTLESTMEVYVALVDETGHYSIADAAQFELTEPEFLNLVSELSGDEPVSPRPDLLYPRKSSLLITTENNTRYLLPVDGGDPVLINDETLALSMIGYPDRYLMFTNSETCDYYQPPKCTIELLSYRRFFRGGRGSITIPYAVRQVIEGEPGFFFSPYGVPLAPGDDALVSPTGAVAIWQGDTLSIYSAHNTPILALQPDYLIASYLIEIDDIRRSEYAKWSTSGQLLAFGDERGAWVWNVFTDSDPRLVWQTRGVIPPYPSDFSSDGRYLTVVDAAVWGFLITIDLQTGEQLEAITPSPDGHYWLIWKPYEELSVPALWIKQIVPPHNEWRIAARAWNAVWLDSDRFVAAIWEKDRDSYEILYIDLGQQSPDSGLWWQAETEPGHAFAISAEGNVAVWVDDATISINRQVIPLDLDAPIADIRWLRLLFWER